MSWFTHGDTQIYYEVTGTGPPLLYLPGFSDQITQHSTQRTTLSEKFRVIAADLPGSGRSGPQPRTYRGNYYRQDAEAFVALLAELGTGPAHLLGHSDGGEVALSMACDAPAVARSVLTWGAAGFASDPEGQIAAFFRQVVDDPAADFVAYRDYLLDSYGADRARVMTRSLADAIDALVAAGGDICRGRAGQIRCPVCLMVGASDAFVTKDLADAMAACIGKAESLEVAGAGHAVHSDRPDWFLQTVAEWLARH